MAGGAFALALLAGGAVWVATHPGSANAPPPSRVAVLPLETLSAGQNVRYLADSISDEMLSVLSANQVEALSRAAAAGLQNGASGQEAAKLGIGFLLNGSVQDDGKETRVSIRLDDARTHVTLWSADYRRDSASAADLRTEVAAKVADIIEIAQFARTNPPTLKDDAALSALLEAHDLVRWDRSRSWARLLELAQRVVTTAPDFAFGHSMLALANAYAIRWQAVPEQEPAMVATARREAARALAIDPRDSSAYFALSLLEKHYREREAVLLKGLAVDGHPAAPFAALNNTEGEVLLSVGRQRDALPFIQRSVALDPLSAVKNDSLIRSYAVVGQTSEAQDLLNQSLGRWPNHPEIRSVRLYFQTFYGGADDALALLKDRAAMPADLTPQAIAAWRGFLDAERTPNPALSARAARSLVSAADAGALDQRTAVLMLSSLGDVDHAFDQAGKALGRPDVDPKFLFSQPAAAMRRDPRFMPLAQRFGLLDYWQGTGKWPDFCVGPHPEIDCRTAAAKAGRPSPGMTASVRPKSAPPSLMR